MASILRRRALILSGAGFAAVGAALLRSRRRALPPGSSYFAGSPLLIAHRGGAGLAPENTLLAFERALSWWRADILELDVQPTADGHAVVFHDADVDRTTDGSGPIADLTLDEIRRLDAGYRFTPDAGRSYPFRGRGVLVPTLVEVLQTCPEARVNIEIKDGRAQSAVWEAICSADALDRVLIAAGSRQDRALLAAFPVPVSATKEDLRIILGQLRLGRVLYVPPVDALQIPDYWEGEQVLTEPLVSVARRRNMPVHVWTVDDVEDMRRYLDWGVDGIVTDRPDRLARLLHDRTGRALPPGPPDPLPEPFLERLLLS